MPHSTTSSSAFTPIFLSWFWITWATKAPIIFLYAPFETTVLSKSVKGFKQVGNGSLYYLTYAQK